jgi:YD repeat-containing protein
MGSLGRLLPSRVRWVVGFAALLLALSAVPVLAEAPEGVVAPEGEAAAQLPDAADIAAGLEQAEREAAEREKWLASPAAVRQREGSQMAYADVGSGAAEALLQDTFAGFLDNLDSDPGRFLSDAKILRSTPGGTVATVEVDGNGMLMDAGIPVRVENEEGELAKVDLSLEPTAAGFETANALSDVVIPESPAAPIEVGDVAVELQAAEAARDGRLIGDEEVFTPEVLPDTDMLVAPIAGGVEIFNQLRSEASPETLRFAVDVPAGARLQLVAEGGAEVVDGEGERLAWVPQPVAFDAQGTEVPVGLQIEGDSLVLEVAHREADVAYPLLVDPAIFEDWINPGTSWINGHGLASLTNNTWAYTETGTWIEGNTYCIYACWGGSGRGLFVSMPSGNQWDQQYGHWSYSAPNANSYLVNAWANPFVRHDHGCSRVQYPQPHDYVGMWYQGKWNRFLNNQAVEVGSVDIQSWGESFILGLATGGGSNVTYMPCWRDVYAGGVVVWLDDWANPTLNPVSGAPTKWVNDSTPLSINVSAGDVGLGVQYVRLYSGASGKWDLNTGCTGLKANACPANLNGTINFGANGFNEGESTASVQAYDPTGKGSNWQQFQIKVDRTSPQLTLDGQLAVATNEVGTAEQPPGKGDKLSMPVYKLKIEAKDGSASELRSGVKDIKVYIDGKTTPEPDTWEAQTCAAGSCPMTVTYPLKLFGLTPGPHTLKVVAIDQAGNETKPERKVEFQYQPATGVKDEYVLHYVPLPDGQGDEADEENPARPELAVNVMNGNLVYREKDVEVEGANADLEVERYYNSLLPEEGNTEWGDGWTLAQTPELEAVNTGGDSTPDEGIVQNSSSALENPALPQLQGQQVFDPVMQATVAKEAGGAYEVDLETSEEAIQFNAGGKVDAVETYNEAVVDYSYEGGALSEIDVEEPAAPTLPPVEIQTPQPPTYASSFGTNGTADGQLKTPADVAVDAAGNLWVADRGNNRIQKFSAAGAYVSKFGTAGTANGQFSGPASIAIDAKGNIYVADKGNGRVQKFNSAGVYVSQFGSKGTANGQFAPGGPEGLAVDAKGNVWVSDTYGGRVQKFDENGTFLKVVGSPGSGSGQLGEPTGIDVGPGGNVWVADWQNNRVAVFDENGQFVRQFGSAGTGPGQFAQPDAIEVDSKGNVWVGDQNNGRVQQFNQSGEYVTQFGSKGSGAGQFNFTYPFGIATDSKGGMWIADVNNNRIQKWTIPGYAPTYSSSFGVNGSGNGQLKLPADLTVDLAGSIWVVDRGNNRVQKLNSKGEYLDQFGGLGSANGQLNAPTSITIDSDDNVWVAEKGNHRIQRFDANGDFVSKFGSYGAAPGQFSGPEGLAVDHQGNLWVSDTYNGRVQKLSPSGAVLKVIDNYGAGDLGEPTGIDLGPGGNVWVTDWQHNRVVVFDDEGGFVRQFGSAGTGPGQFAQPDAIDVDSAGNVWVGDQNNHRVQQFNQSGEFVTQFGAFGAGPGQFSFAYPFGIATDNKGGIWVSDVNNSRVQKWSSSRPTVVAQEAVAGPEVEEPSVDVEVAAGLVDAVEGEEAGEHSYQHEGDLLVAHAGPDGETKYEYDTAGRMTKVTLPNGTTATIAYEATYGRVKSIVADPAGAEPAKTVTFTYYDDTRETRVSETGTPTITYYIDPFGGVFKWAPIGVPPAFDDIGGSLAEYLDKTTPIPDNDHALTISATSPDQVTSIKVLKDGNQLLAEETCTSTPEGRCELEWVTSARAHAPGRLDLELVITNGLGKVAAERHFVTIPYLPPPDPEAPVKPNFEHIKQFRASYGLDLDLAGNQREINKRIWKLLELWELQEPIARASTDEWGVPLRSVDWAELNFREAYVAQAATVLPSLAQSQAGTYAGYYVDHAAGGIIRIGFTSEAEAKVQALKAQLTAPGVRVQAFTAARSLAQLESLEGAIANDWRYDAALRGQITGLSINHQTNKVTVGAQNLEPTTSILHSRYGSAALEIKLTPAPPQAPQSRFNIKGEVQGGDFLTQTGGGSCTAGFGAWDRGPLIRGTREKRYFVLTAGHCFSLNGLVKRALKKNAPYFNEYGKVGLVKRLSYNETVDYTTDSEAVLITDPDLIPRTIYISRDRQITIHRPISVYAGMTLCQSSVASRVPRCGPILSEGEAVTMRHRRSHSAGEVLTMQVPSSAGVIHGDSGGPVYDRATRRPVGLVTGAQHGTNYGLGVCRPVSSTASDCPVLGVTPLFPVPGAAGILDVLGLNLVRD